MFDLHNNKIYLEDKEYGLIEEVVAKFGFELEEVSNCGSMYFYKEIINEEGEEAYLKLRVSNHCDTGSGSWAYGSNDYDIVIGNLGILTGHRPICDYDSSAEDEFYANCEEDEDCIFDLLAELKEQAESELESIRERVLDQLESELNDLLK